MKSLTSVEAGQTPLSLEDLKGLIPGYVTLKSELNELEARNIDHAVKKYLFGKRASLNVSDEFDLQKLHREMFDQVWKWAGKLRKHDTLPIGIDWPEIPIQIREACQNLKYWTEHQTFSPIERAVRFHHRLIVIHPFRNRNGRHGRLAADLYLHQLGFPPLSWSGTDLVQVSQDRQAYLSAMRKADQGEFSDLLQLSQSNTISTKPK